MNVMLSEKIFNALPAADDMETRVWRAEGDDHVFVPARYDSVVAEDDYDYALISGSCRHGEDFSQQIYPPNGSWKSLTPGGLRDHLKAELKEVETDDLSCGRCDHPPCCEYVTEDH